MKLKYNFAYFDEGSKREIRRAILKAVAIPGYQVPFASREMPIARGWGTGGLQITLSLIEAHDKIKVIDQGSDDSVNAVSIKSLIKSTTQCKTVEHTQEASLIQSRHRVPEIPLNEHQIMILQVPMPEPLRMYEASERKTKILHAEKEYSGAWLMLFEEIMQFNTMSTGADHPVQVNGRYVMAPSPIPKFDNPKLEYSEALFLFGAGREKKIYAIPPYTKVKSLDFEDYPFEVEKFKGHKCRICGADSVFLDEIIDENTHIASYQCNDTNHCEQRVKGGHHG